MEETSVHALDYLHILRRRAWWVIVPVVLSIIVGFVLLQVLPKEYQSSATIAVAAPVLSSSYVNSSGGFDNQERLRALSQQLMSTAMLSRVASEAGIQDPTGAGTPQQQQDRVIAAMRLAIAVTIPPESVTNVNEPRRLDSFLISYRDADPDRAQRVADLLAQRFIAENAKTRTARAEGTSAFIAEQLRASQQRLVDFEAKLRAAKELHMGELPEQTQANLSTLTGLRQQLETNATALRGEEDRLSMVERQIQGLRRTAASEESHEHDHAEAGAEQNRVIRLQREVEAARARYTAKHPEVQRLEEELSNAKAEEAAAPARQPDNRLASLQTDPGYRQSVADGETSRLRIRDLQRMHADLQRQIVQYQARVESAPRVEQQLAAMVRDYDLERQQYGELSSKLHAATISENVERHGGNEQFTLLYPATRPTEPTKPVPLLVMLMAVAAGLGLGVGGLLAREYFDRSVRDVRDLRSEFDLPVLGEVVRLRTR